MNTQYLSIEDALKRLHRLIQDEGDILDFPWIPDLLCEYFKHFNDENPELKKGSLLAFWGLLKEWEDQSGQPFCSSGGVRYFDFNDYLEHYLKNIDEIKSQYPATYESLMSILKKLDFRDDIGIEIDYVKPDLLAELRTRLAEETFLFNEKMYEETEMR